MTELEGYMRYKYRDERTFKHKKMYVQLDLIANYSIFHDVNYRVYTAVRMHTNYEYAYEKYARCARNQRSPYAGTCCFVVLSAASRKIWPFFAFMSLALPSDSAITGNSNARHGTCN